jgi:hypothetical protein
MTTLAVPPKVRHVLLALQALASGYSVALVVEAFGLKKEDVEALAETIRDFQILCAQHRKSN